VDRIEYQAKHEWLRLNPRGMRAQAVRRELRAHERELRARGADVEQWRETLRTRRLSPSYVAIFHDRPGQPLASRVRHTDRHCQHLARLDDADIREADDAEVERLGHCLTCAS
jgi:hypothetical protein